MCTIRETEVASRRGTGPRRLRDRVIVARAGAFLLLAAVAGCATHEDPRTVETRQATVGHQRLRPPPAGVASQVQAYTLRADEGYRMPQLHTAPDPVVGAEDPRHALPPTTVCLQVVVDAQGQVERSLPLTDRAECGAGIAAENAVLLRAAQAAVARWAFSPAAVCHFEPGPRPDDRGDCEGAARIEPVPVSLLYAFTFEIIHGRHVVRSGRR